MDVKRPELVDKDDEKSVSYQARQLELISADIIASSDPRLSINLPDTSVYAKMSEFSRNRNEHSEENWFLENGKDSVEKNVKNFKLKVHVNKKLLPSMIDNSRLKTSGFFEQENETESDRDGEKTVKTRNVKTIKSSADKRLDLADQRMNDSVELSVTERQESEGKVGFEMIGVRGDKESVIADVMDHYSRNIQQETPIKAFIPTPTILMQEMLVSMKLEKQIGADGEQMRRSTAAGAKGSFEEQKQEEYESDASRRKRRIKEKVLLLEKKFEQEKLNELKANEKNKDDEKRIRMEKKQTEHEKWIRMERERSEIEKEISYETTKLQLSYSERCNDVVEDDLRLHSNEKRKRSSVNEKNDAIQILQKSLIIEEQKKGEMSINLQEKSAKQDQKCKKLSAERLKYFKEWSEKREEKENLQFAKRSVPVNHTKTVQPKVLDGSETEQDNYYLKDGDEKSREIEIVYINSKPKFMRSREKGIFFKSCDLPLIQSTSTCNNNNKRNFGVFTVLSNFAKLPSAEYEGVPDDMQCDFLNGLVDVMSIDDEPIIVDSMILTSVHLNSLSAETQFESQFYDCPSVKYVHLNEIKKWMREKPLEMFFYGRLKLSPERIPLLPIGHSKDPLVLSCVNQFLCCIDEIFEMKMMLKEDMLSLLSSSVLYPNCKTEHLASELFSEVIQHLKFLSENNEEKRKAPKELMLTIENEVMIPSNLRFNKLSKYALNVDDTNTLNSSATCNSIDCSEEDFVNGKLIRIFKETMGREGKIKITCDEHQENEAVIDHRIESTDKQELFPYMLRAVDVDWQMNDVSQLKDNSLRMSEKSKISKNYEKFIQEIHDMESFGTEEIINNKILIQDASAAKLKINQSNDSQTESKDAGRESKEARRDIKVNHKESKDLRKKRKDGHDRKTDEHSNQSKRKSIEVDDEKNEIMMKKIALDETSKDSEHTTRHSKKEKKEKKRKRDKRESEKKKKTKKKLHESDNLLNSTVNNDNDKLYRKSGGEDSRNLLQPLNNCESVNDGKENIATSPLVNCFLDEKIECDGAVESLANISGLVSFDVTQSTEGEENELIQDADCRVIERVEEKFTTNETLIDNCYEMLEVPEVETKECAKEMLTTTIFKVPEMFGKRSSLQKSSKTGKDCSKSVVDDQLGEVLESSRTVDKTERHASDAYIQFHSEIEFLFIKELDITSLLPTAPQTLDFPSHLSHFAPLSAAVFDAATPVDNRMTTTVDETNNSIHSRERRDKNQSVPLTVKRRKQSMNEIEDSDDISTAFEENEFYDDLTLQSNDDCHQREAPPILKGLNASDAEAEKPLIASEKMLSLIDKNSRFMQTYVGQNQIAKRRNQKEVLPMATGGKTLMIKPEEIGMMLETACDHSQSLPHVFMVIGGDKSSAATDFFHELPPTTVSLISDISSSSFHPEMTSGGSPTMISSDHLSSIPLPPQDDFHRPDETMPAEDNDQQMEKCHGQFNSFIIQSSEPHALYDDEWQQNLNTSDPSSLPPTTIQPSQSMAFRLTDQAPAANDHAEPNNDYHPSSNVLTGHPSYGTGSRPPIASTHPRAAPARICPPDATRPQFHRSAIWENSPSRRLPRSALLRDPVRSGRSSIPPLMPGLFKAHSKNDVKGGAREDSKFQ